MLGLLVVALLVALSSCACTCNEKQTPSVDRVPKTSKEQKQDLRQSGERKASRTARTLKTLEQSAYGNLLFARGEGFVLVTPNSIVFFEASGDARSVELHSGGSATPMGDSIVFHARDTIQRVSLAAGTREVLAKVNEPPYLLLASEDRVAWLTKNGSTFVLRTTGEDQPVYRTEHKIVAGTLIQDWAFLVEALGPRDSSSTSTGYQVTGVALHSKTTVHSVRFEGRPPSQIIGADALYFYADATRGVRRLSLSLQEETPVLTDVICSPLTVAPTPEGARVLCAQLGGVVLIDSDQPEGVRVATEPRWPITAIAATPHVVAWLVDNGSGKLMLRAAPLPE